MQEELEEFYRDQYRRISYSGMGLRFSNFFHKTIEKRYTKFESFSKVLEVGAGDCQHLSFVLHDYQLYLQTDLLDYGVSTSNNEKSRFETQDACKLKYTDSYFDRVISTCLLHHLEAPDAALMEWRRVSREGAKVDILLPSDPGMIYRLARKFASERKVKKKLDSESFNVSKYRYLHAIDHRNHVDSLEKIIRHVFINDKISVTRFPLSIPFWNFNLFSIFHITIQKK